MANYIKLRPQVAGPKNQEKARKAGVRRQKKALAHKLACMKAILPPGQGSRSNKFSSSGLSWEEAP